MQKKDIFKHKNSMEENKSFMDGKILIKDNSTESEKKAEESNQKIEKFRPQGTFYALYPTWINNILLNIPHITASQDVKHIKPNPSIKQVLIFGSGYTLTNPKVRKSLDILLKNRQNTIILAAHSNLSWLFYNGIIPDYIFETDCSPKITDQLEDAFNLPNAKQIVRKSNPNAPHFVMSAHISNKTHKYLHTLLGPSKLHFYKPFVNSAPESKVYNNIQTVIVKPISSYLLQAGCVTNGMLILAEYMHKLNIWPFSSVHFFGTDYCVFPEEDGGRCPRYTYDEETQKIVEQTHEIPPIVHEHMVNYSGYHTTEKDIAYAYDFMNLLEGITRNPETKEEKFSIHVHGNSLAHRFCMFRPIPNE